MLDVPSKYKLVVLTLVAFLFYWVGAADYTGATGAVGNGSGLVGVASDNGVADRNARELEFCGWFGRAGGWDLGALARRWWWGLLQWRRGRGHVALIAWTIVGCLAEFSGVQF